MRTSKNSYVQLLKKLAADEGAQSHASGGRIHDIDIQRYIFLGLGRPESRLWRAYTRMPAGIRGCGVENPQGFGIDKRRFNATNLRSSAFICGSFSLYTIAINRIFFLSYHCIFSKKHKSTFFRSLAEDY